MTRWRIALGLDPRDDWSHENLVAFSGAVHVSLADTFEKRKLTLLIETPDPDTLLEYMWAAGYTIASFRWINVSPIVAATEG